MQFPWSRHGGSRDRLQNALGSTEDMFKRQFSEAMDSNQQQNVPKKSKRFRSAFTTEQVNYLETEFKKFPYIGNTQRKEVANVLNIPERAIKIWFQNRRMKEKKDTMSNQESDDQTNRTVKDEVSTTKLSGPLLKEPSFSLPELTVTPSVNHVAHIDLTSFELNSSKEPDPRKLNYYNDLSPPLPEVSISRIPKPQPIRPPASRSSQTNYRSSAEFSIDLCKKYKTFSVTEEQTKTEDVRALSPVTPPREPSQSSIPKFEHQSSPEDLSYKSSNKRETPSPPKKVHTTSPGLIPVYVNYPQPYFPAGNMLWKPVNVMPLMSTGLPAMSVPSPPGPMSISQEQSKVKKKCNCDCHLEVAPAVPYPDTRSNPQAQYVITALPFQNYPKY